MTGDDFRVWRARHRFTQAQAAEAVGVSRWTVVAYEAGKKPGKPEYAIPLYIAYAVAAIDAGIPPHGEPDKRNAA